MALFPGPQNSVFWFDPTSSGLTDGNLWRDEGRHALHAQPVGYAAPAWGLTTGPSGAKYFAASGAQSATLPLRFYNVAPTAEWSYVSAAFCAAGSADAVLFGCYTTVAGNNFGIMIRPRPTETRHRVYNTNGAATNPQVFVGSVPEGNARLNVVAANVETTPHGWVEREGVTTTWGANAYLAPQYNVSFVPTLLVNAAVAALSGGLYFLALFPFVLSDAEARAFCDWLRDRF